MFTSLGRRPIAKIASPFTIICNGYIQQLWSMIAPNWFREARIFTTHKKTRLLIKQDFVMLLLVMLRDYATSHHSLRLLPNLSCLLQNNLYTGHTPKLHYHYAGHPYIQSSLLLQHLEHDAMYSLKTLP